MVRIFLPQILMDPKSVGRQQLPTIVVREMTGLFSARAVTAVVVSAYSVAKRRCVSRESLVSAAMFAQAMKNLNNSADVSIRCPMSAANRVFVSAVQIELHRPHIDHPCPTTIAEHLILKA